MSDKYAALKQAAEWAIADEGSVWWNQEQLTHSDGPDIHRADAGFIANADPSTILELLAERDADKRRIEELAEDAQELIRFKDVMQKASKALNDGNPLNLESLFKGELASAMFAMMFAGEFTRSGATNYLELLYEVPEFGEFTVTIQKVEGKTPGQRIAELEARTLTVKLPDYRATYKEAFASEVEHHVRTELEKLADAAGISLNIEGE